MKGLVKDNGVEKEKETKKKKIDSNGDSPTTSEKRSNADPIPTDLVIEILLRLPAKSVARFACVSKLWGSIIRGPDFINSFATQSSTRPRFLFILQGGDGNQLIFSSSPYENPLSSVIRTKCLNVDPGYVVSHSVGGLILCEAGRPPLVICNPTTGQVVTLPRVRSKRKGITSFFGYDPVSHQYKVLCMTQLLSDYHSDKVAAGEHQVLTLGAQLSWRMIECSTPHCPATKGLCIDGVLYYGACTGSSMKECILVSFDVRSEKFDFIRIVEGFQVWRIFLSRLINYHGKVALVDEGPVYSIDLLVLEDAKRHRWSRIFVMRKSLRDLNPYGRALIRGTTHSGEIIFAPLSSCKPFYVLCYDIKRDSFRRVRVEGIEGHGNRRVLTFPDHAENIMCLY